MNTSPTNSASKAIVYLIPVGLSDEAEFVLTGDVLQIVRDLDEFVVENEKTARACLKKFGTRIPQNQLTFHLLNEHSKPEEISILKSILLKNKPIGLMSEAGCPGIADPGAEFVKLVHEMNIEVVPFTGPSSIFLALMGSGMNGQSFTFHGYLPRESADRKNKVKELEREALKKNHSQIFIETPYRNEALLKDILECCQENTRVCIASDMTSSKQFLKTKSVGEWKKMNFKISKVPTVFIIGK